MNLGQRVRAAWNTFQNKSIPDVYNITGYGKYSYGLSAGASASDLLKAYRSWVYACVDQRAKSAAAALFRAYLKRGADEWTEIGGHLVLDLLSRPNPYTTKYEFLYRTITHLDLVGDAYWYIARNGLGTPAELWLLPPDRMEVIPHPTEFISGYELVWPDKKPIPFGVGEVIHIQYPNPSDPYYGVSPLTAAAAAADIDTFQHEYQHGFYQNSAIPPIALVTDKALGDVSRRKLKEAWQEGFGGSSNQGKTPVLDNGLKIQSIGISPKDLDWLATNRATRDDILAIFGVPASKLGLVEDVNRSSAVANDYTFAKNTIEPILGLIDEKLTQNLAMLFDANLYIKHDSTIPKDEEARARIMQMRLGSGMTSRNEERTQDGFEPVEGGDEILVPVNYQSLDRALNPPEPVQPSQSPAPVVNNSVTLPEIKMPDIHVTTPAVNVENVAKKITGTNKTTREIKRVTRDSEDRISGIETVEKQEVDEPLEQKIAEVKTVKEIRRVIRDEAGKISAIETMERRIGREEIQDE